MEKGKRDASATELTILARLYEVPVSWFSEPKPTDLEEISCLDMMRMLTLGYARGTNLPGNRRDATR